MPSSVNCICTNCGRTIGVPTGLAPGKSLRCPHCRQTFAAPTEETATRTLDQAAAATSTAPETVVPAGSADQATMTLASERVVALTAAIPVAAFAPRKIGRFEIRRVLGEGGFGIVYEAHDPQLDRAIALKVAKLGGDSTQRIKRFLREAKSAANLRHPHIVPLYEFGQDGDQFYLALAYIPGQSLDHIISERNAKKEKMDPRQAATLMRHLAEALAYAHGLGIVHRDIKPHNVMLDERGDPLLMDFGLAAREMDEKLTREGTIMGTAAYLAPEQYRGEPTPASDQYSLGATLYELLTGETPFAGPPDVQIYNHVHTEPQSPRKRNPAVSRDLETICLKCLEKDAAKWYADCRALAEDLRRWLDGEAIAARPIGIVERLGKWSRKNRLSSTLAGAAAMLLIAVLVTSVVGAAVAGYFAYDAKNQADAAKAAELFANGETERAKELTKKEQTARLKAQRESAALVIAHALDLCENGEAGQGLLGLTRALAMLPPDEAELESVIRTNLAAWRTQVPTLRWCESCANSSTQIAFNPSGDLFVALGEKQVELRNSLTGKLNGTILQHPDAWIKTITFSKDGKKTLTGASDGTATLWETATGKPLKTFYHGKEDFGVSAVALSPDGNHVMTAGGNKSAILWDAASGEKLGQPVVHQGTVNFVAFLPDGKSFLTGCYLFPDESVRQWDLSGNPVGSRLPYRPFSKPALNPNGKTIVFAEGQMAMEWDLATGKTTGLSFRHPTNIGSMTFSVDGRTLVTGCNDGKVRIWSIDTGKLLGTPFPHSAMIASVALSPDDKQILVRTGDGVTCSWSVAPGPARGPRLTPGGENFEISFNRKGDIILTRGNQVRLWNAATGQPLASQIQQESVTCATLSPDGTIVLTGSSDKTARLWKAATGAPLGPPIQHPVAVEVVTFSPREPVFVTGTGGTARFWKVPTGEPAEIPPSKPPFNSGPVRTLTFSPDGRKLITSYLGPHALLCDIAEKSPSIKLETQQSVWCVSFSPDGKTAVTGSVDSTARIWDTGTGLPVGDIMSHHGAVRAVVFSPDGKKILTASDDQTARIWNGSTGKPIALLSRHKNVLRSAAFHRDGQIVATASEDGTARLWHANTGLPLGPPLQHEDSVNAVAFSPEGRTILTGCKDGNAQIWKLPSPVVGDVQRTTLWAQVVTGIRVSMEDDVVRVLQPNAWNNLRQRLQELGGPPVSD